MANQGSRADDQQLIDSLQKNQQEDKIKIAILENTLNQKSINEDKLAVELDKKTMEAEMLKKEEIAKSAVENYEKRRADEDK